MKFYSQVSLSVVVFVLAFAQASTTKAQNFDLKVEAAIVMYDTAANRKINPTFLGSHRTYVLKISKILHGVESSEFILILTGQQFAKSSFNIKRIEPFNLTRVRGCEETVKNSRYFSLVEGQKPTTRLLFSKGVNEADVPMDTILPCYLFRGNDFPKEWWKKKARFHLFPENHVISRKP